MEERMEKVETSRAGVHRRLDDLLQRTTHLDGEVSSTKAKVEDMEKVIVEVTTLRSKAQGAGTLGKCTHTLRAAEDAGSRELCLSYDGVA
jgi:hypothetical protein